MNNWKGKNGGKYGGLGWVPWEIGGKNCGQFNIKNI
jgi:hypothetical protein